ncbi:hypothetical protein [Streptomyces bicolor]|uniref:hypothetical protein n=1 Tax=Streptomyces bicolor TaxID=66874 RepID=UPI0004E1555B|nr:hypothetical protein [Streptomyces bicolor]
MLPESVQPLAAVGLEVLFRPAAGGMDAGTGMMGVRGPVGEEFTARGGVPEPQPAVRQPRQRGGR